MPFSSQMPYSLDKYLIAFIPYTFEKLNINLDENLHISSISALNNARRTAINMLQEKIMSKFLERRNENSSKQVVSLTSLHDGKCSV